MLQLCPPLYIIANPHLLTGRRACTSRASVRRLALYHPSPYSTACSAQRKTFTASTATDDVVPSVITTFLIGVARRCHASCQTAAPPLPMPLIPFTAVTALASCLSTTWSGLRRARALCPLSKLGSPFGMPSGVALQDNWGSSECHWVTCPRHIL